MKYTIKHFKQEFKTDRDCLDFLVKENFKDWKCPKCEKTQLYKVEERKSVYACSCGHQVSPLAGTIFHKSSTDLWLWFFAIFLFSNSKNGVSGKELQRQLGVTYKCAWRMAKQIRKLMAQGGFMLSGKIEVDETYIGGKNKNKHAHKKTKGSQGRNTTDKIPVFGMLERNGRLKIQRVVDVRGDTLKLLIRENVEKGSQIMSDEWQSYRGLNKDFKHSVVKHGAGQYVKGIIHTNSIEGFWSQLKRSVHGTYHCVSPKYLQAYIDEFAYRYNLRNSETHLFSRLVGAVYGKLT